MEIPPMSLTETLEGELDRGLADRVFPCAVAEVWREGGSVAWAAWGVTSTRDGVPAVRSTLFDLASVTKVFTATVAWRLHCRGALSVEDPVRRWFPDFQDGEVRVLDLLRHTSGLPAWYPYYEEPELRSREAVVRDVLLEPIVPAGRARERACYSDLGFIVLREVLEAAGGSTPLPRLIEREVAEPLGLASVRFLPADGVDRPEVEGRPVAATSLCPWRGRVLRGEVHDDNTWVMGGVSGHAGIFGTAADVSRLGAAWLHARAGRTQGFLPRDVALRATTASLGGRTPGFDVKSGGGSAAGGLMSPATFGHLGFTGCSLWCDPDRDLVVVLLSNRIHPSPTNWEIKTFRPAFHDAVIRAADAETR
jgi:CubicO group peptidase (beta-lactamase class C family)